MGVPDLLKFAARAAPAALCRLPSSAHTDTAASTTDAAATAMTFDYILVDATNAAHTVGLDAVYAFLSSPHVTARVAVVFAVDAARDRAGTARQHRQTHLLVGDLDVKVRELCVRLQRCYRERARLHSDDKVDGTCTSPTSALSLPVVLMSGRDVAGEADYKILDIQRGVVAATMLQQQQQQSHVCARRMPTFLFVSEDSDVLCGALCGPCAHHVCIATNLHDTLLELCVLRVSHVLAYLARGTGVMSRLRTARAHAQTQATSSSPQQQQQQLVTTTSVARKGKDDNHKKQRYTPGQDGMCAPDAVAGACAVAVANDRDDVVRRRKVDGPMVATGVRIELHDSSDDEADTTATASAQQQQQPQRASQQTHAQEAAHDEQPQCSAPDALMCTRAARCAPGTSSGEVAAAEAEAAAAAAMHDSCVDLVFLFVLVMGNGAHVAPLLPGVTKVDMASCWHAYCKARHASMTTTTATTLLRVAHAPHTDANDDNNSSVDHNATASRCSLTLSCALLRDILCSVHYADTHARLVSAEERARVMAVLSAAIAATLRYVVGCNVASGAALRDSLLDSRVTAHDAHDDGNGSGGVGAGDMTRTHTPLAGSNYSSNNSSGGSSTVAPSLAAVLFVLQQAPTYTFDVRLRGTATAATTTTTTITPSTSVRNHMHGNDYTRAPHMQLDVRESLVLPCAAPAATMSWAVQHGGGNARRLSLYDVMAAAAAAATPSSTATAATRLRRMSVADTVLQLQQASSRQQQQCVQTTHASHHVTSPRLPLRNSNSSSSNVSVTAQHVLVALQTAWQQSMQSALPLLRRPTTTTTLQMTTTDHKATATPHDGCDKDRLRANGTHTAAPCAAAAADDNNDDDMDAVVDDHDDSSSGLGDSRKSNDDMTARYVYSFELRRMAPILQQSSSSTRQERTAHTRSNNNNNNNNDTSTVAVHARLAALGVSYDYATTATAAAVTATDATLPPRTRKRTHSSSLSSSSSAMHVAGARAAVADASSGVADTASSTRRRRPGKRERMTLLRRASATENDNDTMHARSNNKTTTTTATTATTDTAQAKRKRHATTTNTSATTTKTT